MPRLYALIGGAAQPRHRVRRCRADRRRRWAGCSTPRSATWPNWSSRSPRCAAGQYAAGQGGRSPAPSSPTRSSSWARRPCSAGSSTQDAGVQPRRRAPPGERCCFIATVASARCLRRSSPTPTARPGFAAPTGPQSSGSRCCSSAAYVLEHAVLARDPPARPSSSAGARRRPTASPWPMGLALATLRRRHRAGGAGRSDVFVASVQARRARRFGLTPAFVGFIVVALGRGRRRRCPSAFSAARHDRLDLSVGIALGSAAADRPLRRRRCWCC